MKTINEWISHKINEVSKKLPDLVHQDPASFSCGCNTGYKSALMDLEEFLKYCEDLYVVDTDSGKQVRFYLVRALIDKDNEND